MQFLDATQARVVLALKDSPGWSAELAEALGVSRQSLSNHLAWLRVWPGGRAGDRRGRVPRQGAGLARRGVVCARAGPRVNPDAGVAWSCGHCA
jgi:hypothetical protein